MRTHDLASLPSPYDVFHPPAAETTKPRSPELCHWCDERPIDPEVGGPFCSPGCKQADYLDAHGKEAGV